MFEIVGSIDDLNELPIPDFQGISPREMHEMLYNPIGLNCIVRMVDECDPSILDTSPFLRICEELVKIVIREEHVKLTATGALPLKIVKELYEHGFYPMAAIDNGEFIIRKEDDWYIASNARYVLILSGILRKVKGKLVLTSAGKKEVASGQRLELFRLIFWTFTMKLNWAVNDGYEREQAGQMGWMFILWLLLTSEKALPMEHYLDAYERAFPILTTMFWPVHSYTAEQQLKDCAEVRMMRSFFKWFGLIQFPVEDSKLKLNERVIEKSPLLVELFKLQDRDVPLNKMGRGVPSLRVH